jgi:hypothetical protein
MVDCRYRANKDDHRIQGPIIAAGSHAQPPYCLIALDDPDFEACIGCPNPGLGESNCNTARNYGRPENKNAVPSVVC